VIAEHRRRQKEGFSLVVGWRYLKDRKTKSESAMPAKVSSLLSAQLNRVLKELSREMRRIRTKIALDPRYPFTDECTIDLAALLVADKALASIQLKMIDPGGNASANVKTGAKKKIRAKGKTKVDGKTRAKGTPKAKRKTDAKGKANNTAKAEGKVKANLHNSKFLPLSSTKQP
jgi:hypothetical protein